MGAEHREADEMRVHGGEDFEAHDLEAKLDVSGGTGADRAQRRYRMSPWLLISFATSSLPTTKVESMRAGWRRDFRQSQTVTCILATPSRSA